MYTKRTVPLVYIIIIAQHSCPHVRPVPMCDKTLHQKTLIILNSYQMVCKMPLKARYIIMASQRK